MLIYGLKPMLESWTIFPRVLSRVAAGDFEASEDNFLKAIERAERNLRDYPDNQRAYYPGSGSLILLGEIERGREWIEKALALNPDDATTQYNAACFHAQIGELDLALDLLKGSIVSLTWIQDDPDLDALRDQPRYQAILDSLRNQD